jgi:superfamily I DNA/RNA helicase
MYQIENNIVKGNELLALSFSNKSAKELKERIVKKIGRI